MLSALGQRPIVVALAGPNGAGKTTFYHAQAKMLRKETKRVAFLCSETETEGGWRAMQEDGFLSKDGVHWSHEGLRELEEGDDFTVYADDGSERTMARISSSNGAFGYVNC